MKLSNIITWLAVVALSVAGILSVRSVVVEGFHGFRIFQYFIIALGVIFIIAFWANIIKVIIERRKKRREDDY